RKHMNRPQRLTHDQACSIAFSAFRVHPETRAWLDRHPNDMAASSQCGLADGEWWEVQMLYAEPFPADRPPATIYPGCPGDKPCQVVAVCRVHAETGAFEIQMREPAEMVNP